MLGVRRSARSCSRSSRRTSARRRRWPSVATYAARSSAASPSFATADVNTFGAASLITRITNDVQQMQMLVVMLCTLLRRGADHGRRRLDHGGSRGRAAVVDPRRRHPRARRLSVGVVVIRLIPTFEHMQVRIDRVNQVLREQITGMRVVRAFVREPEEAARFGVANADLTESVAAGRTSPGVLLPERDDRAEPVERGRGVVRRARGSARARCRSAP